MGWCAGKLRGELQQLKNDNVALIGKMKYLEQYNRQTVPMRRAGGAGSMAGEGDTVVFGGANGAARAARYACFGVGEGGGYENTGVSQDTQVGAEVRYRKIYEERMNPFNEFHQKEQERSYRNLRLHDKVRQRLGWEAGQRWNIWGDE